MRIDLLLAGAAAIGLTSSGGAEAQTKYYARAKLQTTASSAPAIPDPDANVEKADGSAKYASCQGSLQKGTIGGGRSAGRRKRAYDTSMAQSACQQFAWENGPGACGFDPGTGNVDYTIGGTAYSGSMSGSTSMACDTAPKGMAKPDWGAYAVNDDMNAVCGGMQKNFVVSGGFTNAETRGPIVGSPGDALSWCGPFAARYGDGACSWSTDSHQVEYVMDGVIVEQPSYVNRYSAFCR